MCGTTMVGTRTEAMNVTLLFACIARPMQRQRGHKMLLPIWCFCVFLEAFLLMQQPSSLCEAPPLLHIIVSEAFTNTSLSHRRCKLVLIFMSLRLSALFSSRLAALPTLTRPIRFLFVGDWHFQFVSVVLSALFVNSRFANSSSYQVMH